MQCLPSALCKCPRLGMCLFHRNVTEHRATSSAVFKHFRSTVQFMYSAADSTAGCTDGEASNGTVSSPSLYTYKSHTIQGTKLLMTCLELSADSVLCCCAITYSSAECNRDVGKLSVSVWSVDIAAARQNTAAAAIWISWSPVSYIVQFSDGIKQIFVKGIPHICSDTAELVHTYIHIYIHTCTMHKYIHIYSYTYIQAKTRTYTYIHYLLTYSMEQSPSWEANWFCS
jgi:hypothetical protein